MKKLKKFEKFARANEELSDMNKNYELSQSDLESIYNGTAGNIEIPSNLNDFAIEIAYFKDTLTKEDVENFYNFSLSYNDFKITTTLASYFIKAHPEIKTEYLDVWSDYAKKWHKLLPDKYSDEVKQLSDNLGKYQLSSDDYNRFKRFI